MSLFTTVDVLIIGGGPAGLGAATTISRLKRSCLLYDSGLYRNEVVEHSHTISGFEGGNPKDFKNKVKSDLEKFYSDTLEFRNGLITNLRAMDDVQHGHAFEALDSEGKLIVAKKVVLATGIKDHLPNIEGVKEQWGKRIIHCIFCHGTETANAPFAFLFTKANSMRNEKLVETMLKLWKNLNHTDRYILTHGMDVDTPEGRKDAGLDGKIDLLKKLGYQIIFTPIQSILEDSSKSKLIITFTDQSTINVPAMLLFPEKFSPSEHSAPLLTEELLGDRLQAWGTIPGPSASGSGATGLPPRMGDDPRTPVRGLFWAGNSGSAAANVTLSLAQGQMAGVMAGDQLGDEELAKL
ncbi:thioredoxin reductase GliT [Kwoniella mangroviensis CBS 10435]|uniref:Thioredoxin reductase GliT n=1 Tax=Kwoniella mangroviensis CBS 10435 TaxID=1331196 RepID=A0A1B9IIU0_9TREE|nr:thioredoxin reductase GliT [Kwoniella mangroviensis CBS 10435]